MRIRPAKSIRGRLRLPGDKSISHRAAILSALAAGISELKNFATSEDCASTLRCLGQLGLSITRVEESVRIAGVGMSGLRAPAEALDCGNSGSTMRMMAGVLAGQNFASEMTGDPSLRSRPMKRVIEPLELMGARISSDEGRAPLLIRGRQPLRPVRYRMPVASAQVKSCLLLAGLYSSGRTEVLEQVDATRDHTERMLRWYGVPVESSIVRDDEDAPLQALSIERPAQFEARSGQIPGDISSASFFIAAASLLPHSRLEINDVSLNPTRTRILDVLRSLGVSVEINIRNSEWEAADDFNEPFGDISVTGGAGLLAPLEAGRSNVLSGSAIPQLIDELPVLAVLGTQVRGGLRIRHARELRVKETDRISATVEALRAMGVTLEEHEDGLTIPERTPLRGARIDARGDHRIAMAFAVAALIAEGESEIAGADCVRVSFPEFFQLLESIVER